MKTYCKVNRPFLLLLKMNTTCKKIKKIGEGGGMIRIKKPAYVPRDLYQLC
jgi:hypothetical protein